MANPVLIVGAGPTGLTAALELSRLGIAVRVIDKLPAPRTTSRTIGVQARTLELLDQRGLAEEMVRLGNRGLGGSVHGDGKRLFHMDFTRVASRYHYILLLSQAETERILSTASEKQGVRIERGVELVGLAQDASSHDPTPVKAVLRHPDGRLEQAQASWLISAEGAHSVVRATLDLPFEGKTRTEHYSLADMQVEGNLAETDFHIFSSEHGFMAMFPLGKERFRLIASHPTSEPGEDNGPSLDEFQTIYNRRSHIPARFRNMSWSSWFRINSRMVPRLRVGRLLLGGDAAHIHSPAGGQGMNTGIQDMINVCWKLALVLQGQAPVALCDTYEQDRLPVMRDVLTTTDRLTDLVGSENAVVRGLFNHLGPWIGGSDFVQDLGVARMSQIAMNYRHSPLSAHHGMAAACMPATACQTCRVRFRNVMAMIGGSGRFTDCSTSRGSRFWLPDRPTRTALPADLFSTLTPWRELCHAFEVAAVPEESGKDQFQSAFRSSDSVYLIRPDGYVGFAGREQTAARQLEAYCRQWLTAHE